MTRLLTDRAGTDQPGTGQLGQAHQRGGLVAVLLLVVLSAVGAAVGGTTVGRVGLAAALLLCAAVIAFLVLTATPTLLFTGVLVLQVFSGNWGLLGLPIGLDRLLLAATFLALAREALAGRAAGRPLRFGAVHVLLLALVLWTALSALAAGTLLTTNGFFALLDRLGVVPFLAFALAPRLYGTPQQRDVLLRALVGLGAYLGTTAVAEGLGLDGLVLPRYVLDPSLGIHAERARGPFLEAVAMGFALLVCAVAAVVALRLWRSAAARWAALAVALLCTVATVFTLTRAIWLASVVAFAAAAAATPALRRFLLPAATAGVVGLVVLLTLVPGLGDSVSDRAGSQRPLWDRYNSNAAALNIVEAEPLTGVGWQRFTAVSADWTEQADDYPVTGVGIEVHNVFLSHASELGLPAAAVFLVAWSAAVVPPLLRTGGRQHQAWRAALLAVAVIWLVVASFGPLSYAFANTSLWLIAGIAGTTARASAVTDPPA